LKRQGFLWPRETPIWNLEGIIDVPAVRAVGATLAAYLFLTAQR
jgi:hypothetical protein